MMKRANHSVMLPPPLLDKNDFPDTLPQRIEDAIVPVIPEEFPEGYLDQLKDRFVMKYEEPEADIEVKKELQDEPDRTIKTPVPMWKLKKMYEEAAKKIDEFKSDKKKEEQKETLISDLKGLDSQKGHPEVEIIDSEKLFDEASVKCNTILKACNTYYNLTIK